MILEARAAAAQLLCERGYTAEAAIVAAGQGDDFSEVRIAQALIGILAKREPASVAALRITRRTSGEEC